MAIHKRIRIAAGLAVPMAVPSMPLDTKQYDQAEHFKQRPRRRMMSSVTPRRDWKRTLLMILIALVAAYLIYSLLKGSKDTNDSDSILSAFSKSGPSKVFYF